MSYLDTKLIKIGVYYDGNYFAHASDYYRYVHQLKSRISIQGLHDYIIHKVAEVEETKERYCHVVDSHYFRGRYNADDTRAHNKLYSERQFDDILIGSGVTTHYLPMTKYGEKGVDVWFALEAYEGALLKKYDVIVLIAGDRDYVPLARKLNALGTRIMLLGWNFEYEDVDGQLHTTYTSKSLVSEVTYPILMDLEIDEALRTGERDVSGIFVRPQNRRSQTPSSSSVQSGSICNIQGYYGFITPDTGGENIFFHFKSLQDEDEVTRLELDACVTYEIGEYNGKTVAVNVALNCTA